MGSGFRAAGLCWLRGSDPGCLGCGITKGLHCSSILGLPYRILIIYLVKPKKGTTMETIGRVEVQGFFRI